jgi:murein L,D-transpeptidase YafK
MLAEISAKNMDKEALFLARIFKEESEMEIATTGQCHRYAVTPDEPAKGAGRINRRQR